MKRLVLCLSVSAAVAGCQTETHVISGPRSTVMRTQPGGRMSLDQALGTDPCASRMRDIEAALLMYYALHKQLPDTLAELAPLAEVDAPLNFTSPITASPFGYSPRGRVAPGRSKRIIIFETVPEHAGRRWCVRMPMTDADAAQSTEVVEVSNSDFEHYLANE